MDEPMMTLVIHSTPDVTTAELSAEGDDQVIHFTVTGHPNVQRLIAELALTLEAECPFEVVPSDVQV